MAQPSMVKPPSRTQIELDAINNQVERCRSFVRELERVKNRLVGERPNDQSGKTPQVDANCFVNQLTVTKNTLTDVLSEFEVILSELSEAV